MTAAAPFKTRKEFREMDGGACAAALRRGILDDICAHMVSGRPQKMTEDERAKAQKIWAKRYLEKPGKKEAAALKQKERSSRPDVRLALNAKMREYRKRDCFIEWLKKYRAENRVHLTAIHRSWVERNPRRAKELADQYRIKNRARLNARSLQWQKENPEYAKLRAHAYRARKIGQQGSVSPGIIELLFDEQGGKCPYCLIDLADVKPHLDHFVSLKAGGLHDDSNLQLLCGSCNCRKRHSDPHEFLRRVMA